MALNWYVVSTTCRGERRASTQLTKNGLETFVPIIKIPDQKNGTRDTIMFPGYIFVRCDMDNNGLGKLCQVPQVIGPVHFEDYIPSLPEEIIYSLRNTIKALDASIDPNRLFYIGESVNVVLGSYVGFGEIIETPKLSTGQASVIVEFLGKAVKAQVPVANLWHISKGIEWFRNMPTKVRRTRGKGRWINKDQSFIPRVSKNI